MFVFTRSNKIIQDGPLKSSPENVVEKMNILLLFKLPVMLNNPSRDQATFKRATFSILAYSLSRSTTTSTYHLYNLSRDQATFKWATLYFWASARNCKYRSTKKNLAEASARGLAIKRAHTQKSANNRAELPSGKVRIGTNYKINNKIRTKTFIKIEITTFDIVLLKMKLYRVSNRNVKRSMLRKNISQEINLLSVEKRKL